MCSDQVGARNVFGSGHDWFLKATHKYSPEEKPARSETSAMETRVVVSSRCAYFSLAFRDFSTT